MPHPDSETGGSANPAPPSQGQAPSTSSRSEGTKEEEIRIIDQRTGRELVVPVSVATIPAKALQEFGLKSYDCGYLNTAVCHSAISYIDGERGILRYRGYDIADLAANSTFLEVTFLLLYGALPSQSQLDHFTTKVMRHTFVHESMPDYLRTFQYDAHPMGMLLSSLSALSTFHPEAATGIHGPQIYDCDAQLANKQIFRLLGKVPTLASYAYRHRIGRPLNKPPVGLGYTESFLYMLDRLSEVDYRPNPVLSRALDICLILHADHEMNCSTAAVRMIASTGIDPFISIVGGVAALYGPLHGGANEAALRMLEEIGKVENIPGFIEQVKAKKRRLMGFGHRVYKSYDPRAKILKEVARDVFEIMGESPLISVARELERIALQDEYFIKRNLYPNVDFYSGIIYKAMGFPTDMFPVLFSIGRMAGWLAHWIEQRNDHELRIFRAQQVYDGEPLPPGGKKWVPLDQREGARLYKHVQEGDEGVGGVSGLSETRRDYSQPTYLLRKQNVRRRMLRGS